MKNLFFVSLSLFVLSCAQSGNTERDKRTLEKRFGSDWYSGQAEITA